MAARARRKTVEILTVVNMVNKRNSTSTCSADTRRGWNSLAESLLHEAGAYAGFGYLTAENVPAGELPGIIYGPTPGTSEGNTYPDESRVHYYVSKLR